MEQMSSKPPLTRAPFSRRRLLALTASAGAGAFGVAALGPLLTTEAASRDERDALRVTMRKLWEDHVVWTRMVIVSAIAGSPDLDAATQRLLSNQDDIGNAIVPYFGASAGATLAKFLREHIVIAAEILREHIVIAAEIAAFLHRANPRSWPLEQMKAMMREHLDLTLAEATSRLTGDWAADVVAYDRVHEAILLMADMLADVLTNRSGHPSRDSH